MFELRRVYEHHAVQPGETCILVDRLWPRGIAKDRLSGVAWWREVAPSSALRRWFGHAPERWPEFVARYHAELDQQHTKIAELRALGRRRTVVLLYAAKDATHNHAAALRAYLLSDRSAPPQ
ncbi:MAG: DUF488 family protein [Gammaproteobacteria bacterium]|nr:DUF488 family protein [Gammaproteobacteria bacterium]